MDSFLSFALVVPKLIRPFPNPVVLNIELVVVLLMAFELGVRSLEEVDRSDADPTLARSSAVRGFLLVREVEGGVGVESEPSFFGTGDRMDFLAPSD